MPKPVHKASSLIATLRAESRKPKPNLALAYVGKTNTERAEAVIAVWESIPKPSRTFKTEAENDAYFLGIADQRKTEMEYDSKLRERGLR